MYYVNTYLTQLREEKRIQRKKERKEKRKKEHNKQNSEDDLVIDNSDLDDVVGQDKSFDSIASFTGDVTNKVGSVGNSVTSGVTVSRFSLEMHCLNAFYFQRIFGDISDIIGTSTSTGQLQPTIGVSFGLPQQYPGYGGYPQNPVGSGGATNPYYTAQEGVEVGPVNLNPLFSLQAGTTDNGDLAVKPLVNLHLTPNGCGILGCEKTGQDGIFPKSIIEAFTNPFGIHSEDYLNKNGISSDYVAPPISSSSYGVPDTSYSAPSTGYGAPSTGYGAPSSGYGAPSSSYGSPSSGYGAPSSSYGAPKPSYNAPQPSYGAPQPSYGAPKPSYEAPQPSYGAPKPSYEAPQSSFLEPVKTFFGLSKPSYNNQESSHATHHHNSKHSSESPQAQNTHIHHHYHHQGEPSTGYTREDISGEENFFLQDSNQVKRKAENFFGSQPNIGGESSSSSSGFRFPRGRDGRNLKLTSEETEGVESLEQEENEKAKAANEESIVKSGSSFKFSERKKRSPDGIGNHGHHGHHDPNAHLGHHDPTAHHGAHSQHIPDTVSSISC